MQLHPPGAARHGVGRARGGFDLVERQLVAPGDPPRLPDAGRAVEHESAERLNTFVFSALGGIAAADGRRWRSRASWRSRWARTARDRRSSRAHPRGGRRVAHAGHACIPRRCPAGASIRIGGRDARPCGARLQLKSPKATTSDMESRGLGWKASVVSRVFRGTRLAARRVMTPHLSLMRTLAVAAALCVLSNEASDAAPITFNVEGRLTRTCDLVGGDVECTPQKVRGIPISFHLRS